MFNQFGFVLIDRDGTINIERHYLSSPEQVELFPHSAEGIKLLRELGFPVVVVTNQSAIGRGLFNLEMLDKIHQRLKELLSEQGTKVDAIYYCPHTPEDLCDCRKPKIAMAKKAAEDFVAILSKSFMIGDNVCDIELGKNIEATTILVRTGYGERTLSEGKTTPDYVVDNLLEAAKLIKKISEDNERFMGTLSKVFEHILDNPIPIIHDYSVTKLFWYMSGFSIEREDDDPLYVGFISWLETDPVTGHPRGRSWETIMLYNALGSQYQAFQLTKQKWYEYKAKFAEKIP